VVKPGLSPEGALDLEFDSDDNIWWRNLPERHRRISMKPIILQFWQTPKDWDKTPTRANWAISLRCTTSDSRCDHDSRFGQISG